MGVKHVELCGQKVRVNENGMVSLTDMWKASGGEQKNKPAHFLGNAKTKEYMRSLEKVGNPTFTTTSGKNGGTWSCKLLAYDYAGWIDSGFKVGAYTVLDQYFAGNLQPVLTDYEQLQMLEQEIKVLDIKGSFHGKGLVNFRHEKNGKREQVKVLIGRIQLSLKLN